MLLPCLCYLLFTPLPRRVLNKLPHRFGSCWQPAKVDLPANVWFPFTCLFSCSKPTFFEVEKEPSPFCISNYLLLGIYEVVEAFSIREKFFNNTPNRCAKPVSWCLLSCQGGRKWHFDRWTEIGGGFSLALEISLYLSFLMFLPDSFYTADSLSLLT